VVHGVAFFLLWVVVLVVGTLADVGVVWGVQSPVTVNIMDGIQVTLASEGTTRGCLSARWNNYTRKNLTPYQVSMHAKAAPLIL